MVHIGLNDNYLYDDKLLHSLVYNPLEDPEIYL